jgi:GTPase
VTATIALVGRPNVGKSTLFNRLVGGRPALVHDTPGLTRDRRYGDADYFGRELRVIDTGGLDPIAANDVVGAGIHRQAERAIGEADALVLVVDGTIGLAPLDLEVASRLRATGKPIVLAVNKIDHPNHDPFVHDFHQLGLGEPIAVSAAHGRGVDRLLEVVTERLQIPAPVGVRDEDEDEDGSGDGEGASDGVEDDGEAGDGEGAGEGAERRRPEPTGPLRVAFVGRPNAGKSSLTNRLLGEERSLVHPVAGTTTDPVDSPFSMRGKDYVLVDTAGIRRKAKVDADVEKIAVSMAIGQIDRADVVVLVIDAALGPSEQDARLAGMIIDAGRGLVIALNKGDLVKGESARAELRQQTADNFHFLDWAPVHVMSAARGDGVDKLIDLVDEVAGQHRRRVQTSELNRFFAEVCEVTPPPIHRGRSVRIHYLTQGGTRPPTFILWASQPEGLSPAYRRFVMNQLRKRWGFRGVPLRIIVRARAGSAREGERLKRNVAARKRNRTIRKGGGKRGASAARAKGTKKRPTPRRKKT